MSETAEPYVLPNRIPTYRMPDADDRRVVDLEEALQDIRARMAVLDHLTSNGATLPCRTARLAYAALASAVKAAR